MIEKGEIKKRKYQCIKVLDPLDIHYQTICDLKLCLIDISKNTNFMDSYDTLIEKNFSSFWNYDAELENSNFMKDLHTTKNKNLKKFYKGWYRFIKILKAIINFKFSRDIVPLITIITSIIYLNLIKYVCIIDIFNL